MAKGVSDLTINEIEIGNRRLPDDTDIETAIVGGGRHRYSALAVLCWLHDRRDNPAVELDTWKARTADQLMEYLGVDDQPDTDDSVQANPTEPTP